MVMSAMVQMRGKIECSYQQGKAKLNKTFHLSPNENICTWRYKKD